MEKLTRQSNFELLRIICMLGVITGHALQSLYDLHTAHFSVINIVQIMLMNVCVVAVNCFVMISGYFRIKQACCIVFDKVRIWAISPLVLFFSERAKVFVMKMELKCKIANNE